MQSQNAINEVILILSDFERFVDIHEHFVFEQVAFLQPDTLGIIQFRLRLKLRDQSGERVFSAQRFFLLLSPSVSLIWLLLPNHRWINQLKLAIRIIL